MRDSETECKDQLFLMEVYVEKITLDPRKKCCSGPLKVIAQFLNYPPVEIEQLDGLVFCKELADNRGVADDYSTDLQQQDERSVRTERFCSGKSCMFSMDPDEMIKTIGHSPLTVNVFGKECEGMPRIVMGGVKIYLSDAFMEAVSLAKTPVVLPVTAYLEESFIIRNIFGEPAGEISLFIRLSCFGLTKFTQSKLDSGEAARKAEMEGSCKEVPPIPEVCKNLRDHLEPLVTCEENLLPSTFETSTKEAFRKPVPWRLIPQQRPPLQDQRPQATQQQPSYQRPQAKLPSAKMERLVCTCDRIPDVLVGPPPPVAWPLRCECADILANLRCQPPYKCEQPPPTPPTAAANVQHQPPAPSPPQSVNKLSPVTEVAAAAVQPPAALFPVPENIVPTSEVCGLELKAKGHHKSASEEKVNIPKIELKKTLSSSELPAQPLAGEMNAAKVLEQEVVNWDAKKKRIETEYQKKKKTKNIYVYTEGMYPGMVIGHKYCIPVIRTVPRNMGWLWNIVDLQAKGEKKSCGCCGPDYVVRDIFQKGRGWRPGTITKTVASNFGHWKRAAGLHGDVADTTIGMKKKRRGQLKGSVELEGRQLGPLNPTLHVHKKDGFYYITVHPAGEDLPPDVKPLAFKVDPRKGSSDEATSSDTSEDSFQFEYTTPAALVPPKRKIDKQTDGTQYYETDFLPRKKVEQQLPVEELKLEAVMKEDKKSKKGKGKQKTEKKGRKGKKK